MSLFQHSVLTKYLKELKQKAQTLKSEIIKTDRVIDRIIYELYGLTEEEIGIVEELVIKVVKNLDEL
jgi:type II restriction/modification system DNA methylase subunit YeeA